MNISVDTLFAEDEQAAGAVVTALNHQDIVVALSAALANERVAVLHMLYPRTDARRASVAGASHGMNLARPAAFNELIDRFVSGHGR